MSQSFSIRATIDLFGSSEVDIDVTLRSDGVAVLVASGATITIPHDQVQKLAKQLALHDAAMRTSPKG